MEKSEELEVIEDKIKEKKEKAIYDINTIMETTQQTLDVLQVQITKTLKTISDVEEGLKSEMEEYWMKELPISNKIRFYLESVTNLITVYTQQEEAYKKAIIQIVDNINFPKYERLRNFYEEELIEKERDIEVLKEEMKTQKEEIKEQFEEKLKNERQKVHDEYEEAFEEVDQMMGFLTTEQISRFKDLIDEKDLEKINSRDDLLNLVYFFNQQIVDDFSKLPISIKVKGAVIDNGGTGFIDDKPIDKDDKNWKSKVKNQIKNFAFVKGMTYSEIRDYFKENYNTTYFYNFIKELEDDDELEKKGTGKTAVLIAKTKPEEGDDEDE